MPRTPSRFAVQQTHEPSLLHTSEEIPEKKLCSLERDKPPVHLSHPRDGQMGCASPTGPKHDIVGLA